MADRHELKTGPAFAEFAEAIGVPTSQIMAAVQEHDDDRCVVVSFTPEPVPDDDPDGVDTTAWLARLRRDGDGIYRQLSEPEPSPFSVYDTCRAIVAIYRGES